MLIYYLFLLSNIQRCAFKSILKAIWTTTSCLMLVNLSAAPNDDFSQRIPIEADSITIVTEYGESTIENDEWGIYGSAVGSLWWSWTPGYTGDAILSTYGSDNLHAISVYQGSELMALSEVTNSAHGHKNQSLSFSVVAGTTYAIAVRDIGSPAIGPAIYPGEHDPELEHKLQKLVLSINQPPAIIADSLIFAQQGKKFSKYLIAMNQPTRFEGQGVPPGMVLDPKTGQLRGVPSAVGIYEIDVTCHNAWGSTTARLTFEVYASSSPPAKLAFRHLQGGYMAHVDQEFSLRVYTDEGLYNLWADNLPPGLCVVGNTIQGKPTEVGEFAVKLTASTTKESATAFTYINVTDYAALPILNSAAYAQAVVGSSFYYSISNTDVLRNAAAISVGELPDGLIFSTSGLYSRKGPSISGVPTVAGLYSIPIVARNAAGRVESTLTLEIVERDKEANASITGIVGIVGGRVGEPMWANIVALNYSGPITTIDLPPGLELDEYRYLSGTPEEAGTFVTTITIEQDGKAIPYRVVIEIREPQIELYLSTQMYGQVDDLFHQFITESNDATVEVAGLPPGIELQDIISDDGIKHFFLEGTPSSIGIYPIITTVSTQNDSVTAYSTIHIGERKIYPPHILSQHSLILAQGEFIDYRIYAWRAPTEFGATDLPEGISVDTSTGKLSGATTELGVHRVIVSATNEAGTEAGILTIQVVPATPLPIYQNAVVLASTVEPINYEMDIPYLVDALYDNGLPPGLSREGNLITGLPTIAGTFQTHFEAFYQGSISPFTLTFHISDTPSEITGKVYHSVNLRGYVGEYFGETLYSFEHFPFDFQVSNLPPGLTFNDGGQYSISGYPTTPGSYDVEVLFSDELGNESSTFLVIDVFAENPASDLPRPRFLSGFTQPLVGKVDAFISEEIRMTNDSGSSFSISNLPPGLFFDQKSRKIFGTPSQAGIFHVALTATNAGGSTRGIFTFHVEQPTMPSLEFQAFAPVLTHNYLDIPINSDIPQDAKLIAYNLPPGLRLTMTGVYNEDLGVIEESTYALNGRIQSPGIYEIEIQATNSVGTAKGTMTIAAFAGTNYLDAPVTMVGQVGFPFNERLDPYSGPATICIDPIHLPRGIYYQNEMLQGVPEESGLFTIPYRLKDDDTEFEGILTLRVYPANDNLLPIATAIATASIVRGNVDSYFHFPLRPALTVDNLPEGLYYDATNGDIIGLPANEGTYFVHVMDEHSNGISETTISIIIDPKVNNYVEFPPYVTASVGDSYVQSYGNRTSYNDFLTIHPDSYEHVWAQNLPPGLHFNKVSGVIEGTFSQAGVYQTELYMEGSTQPVYVNFYIAQNDLTSKQRSIPRHSELSLKARLGVLLSHNIYATETGNGFSGFSVTGLPPGLDVLDYTLASSTLDNGRVGTIVGTPTQAGIFPLTITLNHLAGSTSYISTLVVEDTQPFPKMVNGHQLQYSDDIYFNVFNSLATHDVNTTIQLTNIPAGLDWDPETGLLTGIPEETDRVQLIWTAMNNAGTFKTVMELMRIEPQPMRTYFQIADPRRRERYQIIIPNPPPIITPPPIINPNPPQVVSGNDMIIRSSMQEAPIRIPDPIHLPTPTPPVNILHPINMLVSNQVKATTLAHTGIPFLMHIESSDCTQQKFTLSGTLPEGISLRTEHEKGRSPCDVAPILTLEGVPIESGTFPLYIEASNRGYTTSCWMNLVVSESDTRAPAFLQHPQSEIIQVGDSITFSATASGSGSLSYQWLVNGSAIMDTNEPSLTLYDVPLSYNGNQYQLRVSNDFGTLASIPVTLTIRPLLYSWEEWYNQNQSAIDELGQIKGKPVDAIAAYAHGLNPYDFDLHELPRIVLNDNLPATFTYQRSKQAEGITYTPQWSTDCINWHNTFYTHYRVDEDREHEYWSAIPDILPAAIFFRLTMELEP